MPQKQRVGGREPGGRPELDPFRDPLAEQLGEIGARFRRESALRERSQPCRVAPYASPSLVAAASAVSHRKIDRDSVAEAQRRALWLFERDWLPVGHEPLARLQGEGEHEYETRRREAIKVSRGEENIFIWCFFLAIVELALDDDGTGPYDWVKYIYIDDPISSLDEHNAIAVANHLAKLLKRPGSRLKTVISTHHTLFFNVLCNELNKANKYFLSRDGSPEGLLLSKTGDTPFFYHVAALTELYEVERDGRLKTHHFNMLRAILEKTASFHGYQSFSECIKRDADDEDGILHTRLINILSHGNYSLFEPQEMLEENKRYFRKILREFINRYPFNPALFPSESATETKTSNAT